jgi:hypothetical protein
MNTTITTGSRREEQLEECLLEFVLAAGKTTFGMRDEPGIRALWAAYDKAEKLLDRP